jgi:ABC-type Fe3+-hydroxamate transport system substrate-binding protein
MKKFGLLITLFVLVLVLISCSSDDSTDSPVVISDSIVGAWTGTTVDYSGTSVTTLQGQSVTADFVGEAYDINYTVTFSENPNILVSVGSYSLELTYTILGQTTTENVENVQFLEDGTWEQNEDELIVTNNGETTAFEILELTSNRLKLGLETIEEFTEQGADITSTIYAELTFTK